MKFNVRLFWTSETDYEIEADSREEAEQKGYQMIEDICVGTSINPDVIVL